jgi:hypothetical protein
MGWVGVDVHRGASIAGSRRTSRTTISNEPAGQVRRQRGGVGRQDAAEVDDARDTGALGRPREVVGADQIEILEPALDQPRRRQHRVHQIDRDVDADQRGLGVLEREQVAGSALPIAGQPGPAPRQRDQVHVLAKRAPDRLADEPGRAGHRYHRSPVRTHVARMTAGAKGFHGRR